MWLRKASTRNSMSCWCSPCILSTTFTCKLKNTAGLTQISAKTPYALLLESADRRCHVFWQHGGWRPSAVLSEGHNLPDGWITHQRSDMNTAAAVQEGDFQSCMLRLTLFIVLWNIDQCWKTRVWAQAEPVVSGCESIFNCCPPQVQSRLLDITNMCRSPTFNTWYLYLQAGSLMPHLVYRRSTKDK